MIDAGYITHDIADRASHEPLVVVQRALEAEAPYFVDYVGQTLDEQYPGLTTKPTQAAGAATKHDLHLHPPGAEPGGGGRRPAGAPVPRRPPRRRGGAAAPAGVL